MKGKKKTLSYQWTTMPCSLFLTWMQSDNGRTFLLCELRKKKETGCMQASEEKKKWWCMKEKKQSERRNSSSSASSFFLFFFAIGRSFMSCLLLFFCRCLKKTREEKKKKKKKNKKIPFQRHSRYHHQLWHLKIVFPSLSLFFLSSRLTNKLFFSPSLLLGVIADRIAAVSTTATFFFITRWMCACAVLWSGL